MEDDATWERRDQTWKIRGGIALQDVLNDKGAEFEVEQSFDDEEDDVDQEEDNRYFNREEVFKNLNYACNDGGGSDEEEDELTPFERLAKKMDKITDDGGVLKMLLQPGTGSVVPAESIVRVHYNAYLEYSDEPYDSTRLRNAVKKFRLGKVEGVDYSGEIVPGISLAVASMKKGELSRYLIKPEYAYREYGCAPRIPGGATLMYEIELLSFVEQVGIEDFFHLTTSEQRSIPWTKVKMTCDAERKEGNILFESKNFHRAQIKYKKAINVLEEYHLKDEEEEVQQQKLLLKLYLNISLCYLRLARAPPTITYCKKALEIDRRNVKAQYRMGQALHKLGDFDRAKHHLKLAQKLEPNNPDINAELGKLARSVENFRICEKQMYQKMFSKPEGRTESNESKSEDKSLVCSDDFRNVVREKFLEMRDTSDVEEMPFPCGALTVAEISCILETAEELGLDVIQRGKSPHIQMTVSKKKKSNGF